MRLHEYQAKLIFSRHNIPTPQGQVTNNADSVRLIAESIGDGCVIKAQVLSGGRGKAGGIRVAKTSREARELATNMMGISIHGMKVHKVLVEEAIKYKRELYLAFTIDRENATPIIIASSAGGIDIEDTYESKPECVIRIPIDPLVGVRSFHAQQLSGFLDIPIKLERDFCNVVTALWDIFSKFDALLIEINPLVVSETQHILALDAKMEIDDSSLFRHPDVAEMRDIDIEDELETEARKFGLSYIRMEGDVGCLVNGAGLAMITMDLIQAAGGKPANFLDIGGGATAEKVAAALRIMLSDSKIKSVLVNIFGGITRCDEVAKGILTVKKELKKHIPMIVRLQGTNADIAALLLKDTDVLECASLSEAAQKAVEMVRV